jgi:hypothetical protein
MQANMHRRLLFPTLSLILASVSPALAAEMVEVAPLRTTAPWIIELDESECRMSRRFGSDNATTWVQINRDGPLSSYTLAISSSDLPKRSSFDAQIRFDGDEDWTPSKVARSKTAGGADFFVFPEIPDTFWQGLAQRFTDNVPIVLRIRAGRNEVAFNLQKMKAVKVELDKCEDALMSKAGLDGPSLRALQQPATPIGSPLDWIKSEDYPFTMLSMGKSAALLVWLDIDETGKVTDCRVINAIGDGPFRKRGCEKLIERAKFQPAISASGSPIRSYMERKIIWTVEGEGFRR